MSLKTRLLVLITGAVAVVTVALSALQLNSLVSTLLSHASERSQAAAQLVKTYVLLRTSNLPEHLRPPSASIDDLKLSWRRALETDRELPEMLAVTLAETRSIVEISVADEGGRILTSSNSGRLGSAMDRQPTLKHLQELNPFDRLATILGSRLDYESRVVLGLAGRPQPVFTIQVLVSSVLLREAVMPEVRRAALLAATALLISVLVAYSVARHVLRPLALISRTIDRISSGKDSVEPPDSLSSTREFYVVEQKLRLLGAQFRDTQKGVTRLRGGVERLMENIEEAVLLFDPAGRPLACAQAAERLLGLGRDRILAQRIDELFPPGTAAGDAIGTALRSREPVSDFPFECNTGPEPSILLMSLELLPAEAGTERGGVLLRLRDAEGRKALEAHLNISARLAAISRLTGGVAHEIKNPLNSIALRLELLRSRVLPEIPEAKGELEVIAQEIARLDRVVRTFLDFTRPVELSFTDFDLAEVVRGILDLVRPEAARLGVAVEAGQAAGPVRLRGDKELLQQAIVNIVRNALDAMPEGGKLEVRLAQEAGEVALAVSDTGPGVAEEIRDRIFQLYFSTKESGSGIGLAMAYRAAQLHGGTIDVDSAPGRGATFRMRVPAAGGAAAS